LELVLSLFRIVDITNSIVTLSIIDITILIYQYNYWYQYQF